MIQAVTFDLWGTLIVDFREYDRIIQKKRCELLYTAVREKVSREELVKALKQSWSQIQSVRKTLKDVPTSEQVRMLQTLLNVDCNLEKPYTEAILCELPQLNPYTKKVLQQVKTKKGLISNTGRTPGTVLRSVLSDFGLLKFFDVTLFSNEVGYLKPHPEIFRQASHALGVPPSRILHVGDDTTTDIEGARKAGMQTLLVRNPSDLQKVLELI